MTSVTIDAAAILRDLERAAEAERVRLVDLSRRIGWSEVQQSKAIRAGLLEAERDPTEPRTRPYTITRDDAFTLLLAAVLAFLAGSAIASALRGVQSAGLTGPAAAAAVHAIVQT
jgi:hypothetical protein